MKTVHTIVFCSLAIAIMMASCSASKNKINNPLNHSPESTELYNTVVHLDSALFDAFNTRNLDKLKTFFSENLEFYHDLGGVTNYQQNLDAFKRTFESDRRVRREVVAGSLEVTRSKIMVR